MIVTLDTNIVYQGFRNPNGPSGFILSLIAAQKVEIALSNSVMSEYEDVLLRPSSLKDCRATGQDVADLLERVGKLGVESDIYFRFRPNLRDEADNMFVELALTTNSRFLITSNVRDFLIDADLKFDDLHVVTPIEFLKYWRRYHV